MLSPDEAARAERYRHPAAAARFLVARAALRWIVGELLGDDPAAVALEVSASGKPRVRRAVAGRPLEFNVSHSGDLVLIGVTLDHSIGVDVEWMRGRFTPHRLADRFFAPGESDVIRARPVGERAEMFFRYWTLKEAFLKARGDGLAALADVIVAAAEPEPRLLRAAGEDVDAWSLATLAPAPGYAAAMAVRAPSCAVSTWHWEAASILSS